MHNWKKKNITYYTLSDSMESSTYFVSSDMTLFGPPNIFGIPLNMLLKLRRAVRRLSSCNKFMMYISTAHGRE